MTDLVHAGTITPARHIPRDAFDRATGCIAAAQREAARIIAAAQAAADTMEQAHKDQAAALDARAAALEDAAFRNSLEHANAAQRAAGAADVLDEATRMRAAFVAMTPWLNDLVQTCLSKIIGTIDNAKVIESVVATALADMNGRQALILRVAAVDLAEMQGVIAQNAGRFAAVSAVVPDAGLQAGTILLEGHGGFVEIGIAAQLRVLAGHLADTIPATVRGAQ